MSILDLNPEERRAFLEEASEQVQILDEDIVRLERESADSALLDRIFRAAHTLKGSSGMIGLDQLAELTHAMEDILDRLRTQSLSVTAELIDCILTGVDGMKQLLADFSNGVESTTSVEETVAKLRSFDDSAPKVGMEPAVPKQPLAGPEHPGQLAPFTSEDDSGPTLIIEVRLNQECEWRAVRMLQLLTEAADFGEVRSSTPSASDIDMENVGTELVIYLRTDREQESIEVALLAVNDVQSLSMEIVEQMGPGNAPPQALGVAEITPTASRGEAVPSGTNDTSQSVRVDTATLDSLMNLAGELVTGKTQLTQISRSLSGRFREDESVGHLAETVSHLERVVDELSTEMAKARMLPVDILFSKFPRLVRDIARSLNKNVDFVIEGADTEIDRSVIDKIRDPILHMLRNSLDHGVETESERLSAGKDASAVLTLSARHEQGQVLVSVADDGKGIDPEFMRDTAVKRSLITRDDADKLTDEEAVNLVFLPGFSSAEKATDLSGRGVGVDVVRRSAADLGGNVSISTQIGAGTKFTLKLPLTLATFRALLVVSDGVRFAIPLNCVQETVQLEDAGLHSVFGNEVLNLRGAFMPLVRLNRDGIQTDQSSVGDHRFVVVLQSNDRVLALGVHELMEQQEVVIKPLEGNVGLTRGVAGATILGDGKVALVLDIQELERAATPAVAVEPERIAA